MLRSRWLRRAGPGIAALGAVAVLASTTLGARDHPWVPPDCADVRGGAGPAARVGPPGASPVGRGPWFRLDPVLDGDGALHGQRLAIGQAGGASPRMLDLPPESFAAGPFGAVVLVGRDDGIESRLVALDALDGCATVLATSTDVIRRATVSPDGTQLVEHRVDRRTRVDLGTWRRPLDGSRGAVRILPPIDADPRFGRTWSTTFAWDEDRALAVESCGEVACRTRVVGATGSSDLALADPDVGTTLGLANGRLVSYLACRGLPCPIVATDMASGHRRVLVDDAGSAVVIATAAGPRLVHVRAGPDGTTLHSQSLDGSHGVDLGPVPNGYDLEVDPARSGAGMDVPPGWVVLAPHGRLPIDRLDPSPILRHVLDGRSASTEEVLR